jgi:uncharacterized membrane protein YgcG
MRRWLAALGTLFTVTATAGERILDYHSRIVVHADASLSVTETIRVLAQGERIKRGIFREFPTRYPGRDGNLVRVGFDLESVRRDGVAEPYRQERRANGVATYIGDPDRHIPPGEHVYEIAYRTDRQVGLFTDHDELYWNVTGNGWQFHIDRVSAEVILPAGVPAEAVRLIGYTGPSGARWQNYRASNDDGVPRFASTRSLANGEGLTIVVMWPKGFVARPGFWDRMVLWVRDNRPLAFAGGGLLGLLAYYLLIWTRVGRDPPAGVTHPRYRPPEGESPASMRYLRRMGYDTRCFAAAVLSIAVKGYLVIQDGATRPWERGSYTLCRQRGATTPLAPDEHALLRNLFPLGETLELKDDNHSVIAAALREHEKVLKRLHVKQSFRINRGWQSLGVLISPAAAAAPFVAAAADGFDPGWFLFTPMGYATVGLALACLLCHWPFAFLLRAPTQQGRGIMDEVDGFRLYLEVAEGDEIKLAQAPRTTPGLFETYLPFALALDVEQKWAAQFASLFHAQAPQHQPEWYRGERWDALDVGRFSSGLGESFDSAISSASTPPGSSSGGGGGGSSGGGGGGGGGGGW